MYNMIAGTAQIKSVSTNVKNAIIFTIQQLYAVAKIPQHDSHNLSQYSSSFDNLTLCLNALSCLHVIYFSVLDPYLIMWPGNVCNSYKL